MKNKSAIYTAPLAVLLLPLLLSCKKEVVVKEDKSDDIPISISAIIFNPNLTYGTMTDQDGNTYKTITIGTQTWMAENLRTTKWRNGGAIPIPYVTDDNEWENLTYGAYCNYNNDAKYTPVYGRLYNWFAVNDSRNLAPAGWHVPSDDEWTTLAFYLGGVSVAGGKLKETGTSHWFSPNTGATNETGFTALPGGYRDYWGKFRLNGDRGYWWTSTEDLGFYVGSVYFFMTKINAELLYYDYPGRGNIQNGYSVRCVKD
jgi:uncharacterized protein (TIGR02145 family)